jgi:hypothetical protein
MSQVNLEDLQQMKNTFGWRSVFFLLLVAATAVAPLYAQDGADIQNPNIDMAGHLKIAMKAAEHRESRRVSEKEFMRMSAEPETNVYELGPLIDIDASKLTFEPPLNSFWEKTKRKLYAMGREIAVVPSVRNSQRSMAGLYYGFP